MTSQFKIRFWKIGRWVIGIFFLMFFFRLIYGYMVVTDNRNDDNSDYFGSVENLRKNYATEKWSSKGGETPAAPSIETNQKYEKTASIRTKSSEFDKDEKDIKAKAKSFNGIIQYEQALGQKGNRQLHLSIGVNPFLFDSLYVQLKNIGLLRSTQITKVDKTNEYRQLNAQKASIEKTLNSLNDLKSKTGQISDFVTLNEKILEIEEKAQELGVELGNFDTENEFCTIKYSLYEGNTEKNVSLMHRVKVALEWTIEFYLFLAGAIFIWAIVIFILILIIDKLKLIGAIKQKLNE